jgi:peptidoglycan hydrolase CwlO-like protein
VCSLFVWYNPLMDIETLRAKSVDVEKSFSEVTEQRTEIEREQYRLQGEHRLLKRLIVELETQAKTEEEKAAEPKEQ